MRPKPASKHPENTGTDLTPYVSKFLYFIGFIQSLSPLTVKSYRNDLCQAFGLDRALFSECSEPQGAPDLGSKLTALPEKELMERCRAAQHHWAALAPSSRNRKAACLKSFLNWLYSEQLIERELAYQVHGPKVPVRLPHYLSVDEALALLHSLQTSIESASSEKERTDHLIRRTLVLLLYGGGLRVSEACGLEWRHVDFDQKLIRITGKGGKERIVALPPMVIASLKELKSKINEIYVFGSEPLGTRTAYDMVRTAGARAGLLKPLHPHALRHSFATHLLSSGANLRTLQELLGHQTLQATQRYTHVGIDQLARTMESFHPLGEKPLASGPKPSRKPS